MIKLLHRPGSPVILVFDLERRYPIPSEALYIQRRRKTHECGENLQFSIEVTVYLENGTS